MEPRLQKLCSNATKVTPAEWKSSVNLDPLKKVEDSSPRHTFSINNVGQLTMDVWGSALRRVLSLCDWNQHHSRRISTNHQLQWRKDANNILVKSPQYHVMYLRSGCFDGLGGPQGCAMQLRLVDQRTVHCSEPPMDPSLEGRERMDGWWYTRRRNTPLREKTIGKDDAPIKEDW